MWRSIGILVVLILFSGCTQDGNIDLSGLTNSLPSSGVGDVSFKELSENPEKYVNKTITEKGKLIMGFTMGAEDFAYLEDDKGYRLKVVLPGKYNAPYYWDIGNRNLYPGEIYSIRGNFTFYEKCLCQQKKIGETKWKDTRGLGQWYGVVRVDMCPNPVMTRYDLPSSYEYRCKPDSIERTYYLEPIEIK